MLLLVMFQAAMLASLVCRASERATRGVSLRGDSRCACGKELALWRVLPVLPWVLARGRARCCGRALPRIYPVVEAGAAGIGALCLGLWSVQQVQIALLVGLAGVLVVMTRSFASTATHLVGAERTCSLVRSGCSLGVAATRARAEHELYPSLTPVSRPRLAVARRCVWCARACG